MMPNIHDARLAPARNCSRLRSARSTATCARSSASCWLRDNERAKRRSRGNRATMSSPISSDGCCHAFMTNNTSGTCVFFHATSSRRKNCLPVRARPRARRAAGAQLPQVQLPQVPGVRRCPPCPSATRAAGGTLRELAGARALRVEQLVRAASRRARSRSARRAGGARRSRRHRHHGRGAGAGAGRRNSRCCAPKSWPISA